MRGALSCMRKMHCGGREAQSRPPDPGEAHQHPSRPCIKREALQSLLFVKRGEPPSVTAGSISDDALRKCFRAFAEPMALSAFGARLKRLKCPAGSDQRARVYGLAPHCRRILEECGCASRLTDCPKLAASHQRIISLACSQAVLESRWEKGLFRIIRTWLAIVNCQKEADKYRKDFRAFMSLSRQKAVACEEIAMLQARDKADGRPSSPQPYQPETFGLGKRGGKRGGKSRWQAEWQWWWLRRRR